MSAIQENATSFNPNSLELTLLASYDRIVKTNITRVWENVLDWEHLPHLHSTSFDHIMLDEAGDWGWRTWSNPDKTDHIELCVDETKYVARSYREANQISEIWTHLSADDEQTVIHVEFHGVNVKADAIDKLGNRYLGLYKQLWDEDESMMMQRQHRLTESRKTDTRLNLGKLDQLQSQLPLTIQMKNREFRLLDIDGTLVCHPTICPHLLGPLTVSGGTASCPWHGYRFDIETGDCLSPDHAGCKLPDTPVIIEESGNIVLEY